MVLEDGAWRGVESKRIREVRKADFVDVRWDEGSLGPMVVSGMEIRAQRMAFKVQLLVGVLENAVACPHTA